MAVRNKVAAASINGETGPAPKAGRRRGRDDHPRRPRGGDDLQAASRRRHGIASIMSCSSPYTECTCSALQHARRDGDRATGRHRGDIDLRAFACGGAELGDRVRIGPARAERGGMDRSRQTNRAWMIDLRWSRARVAAGDDGRALDRFPNGGASRRRHRLRSSGRRRSVDGRDRSVQVALAPWAARGVVYLRVFELDAAQQSTQLLRDPQVADHGGDRAGGRRAGASASSQLSAVSTRGRRGAAARVSRGCTS